MIGSADQHAVVAARQAVANAFRLQRRQRHGFNITAPLVPITTHSTESKQ